MHELKERMAYLRGLASGLNVDADGPQGRILLEMMEVLDGVVQTVDRLAAQQDDLESYLGAIDEDLSDLEQDFYDEYHLDDEDDQSVHADETVDEEDDDIQYLEIKCPHCHEMVFVDSALFDDDDPVEVQCPGCRETIVLNDEAPVTT